MSEDSVFIKFGGHNLKFFHHYHVNNGQLTKNISYIILYQCSQSIFMQNSIILVLFYILPNKSQVFLSAMLLLLNAGN
jgi:hypothetical protein